MKFEQIDQFASTNSSKYSCVSFVEGAHEKGDVLFVGSEHGKLYYFLTGTLLHRQEPLSRGPQTLPQDDHGSEVLCLLHSKHKKICPNSSYGLLFSGSRDRTIKVWDINPVRGGKSLVQTLFGHGGGVSALADGADGTILSCSVDGSLRMWAPQRGRSMMLNPFFDCSCTVQISKTLWLTALAIKPTGSWSCYVGDSSGSIEIFRKGAVGTVTGGGPTNDGQSVSFNNLVSRVKRWEYMHDFGINHMQIIEDESFLISLSFDGTCRVSDATLGQTFYSITNPRHCMYTGVSWAPLRASLFLVDELGNVEIYSTSSEKSVVHTQLYKPRNAKHQGDILSSHKDPILSYVLQYRDDQFFTLLRSKTDGEISLWQLYDDNLCIEFVGHEGAVVGIGFIKGPNTINESLINNQLGSDFSSLITRTVNKYQGFNSSKKSLISEDESVIFSAGNDYTIRCWDEFDHKENYQFKNKGNTEITSMLYLSNMNEIATGHENGTLCIWHADAGTKIYSHALQNSISCLIEAKNIHSQVLIGADYSGVIAIWNLTLCAVNPGRLPTDVVFKGHHDPEDPTILSIAYHWESRTLFSGGNDRTIRSWRIGNEIAQCTIGHAEGVCSLTCAESLLLSGDERGELILWRLVLSSGSTILPTLTMIARWTSESSTHIHRAVCMLQEGSNCAHIVQAGKAGKTTLWRINISFISTPSKRAKKKLFKSVKNISRFGPTGKAVQSPDTSPSVSPTTSPSMSPNVSNSVLSTSRDASPTRDESKESGSTGTYYGKDLEIFTTKHPDLIISITQETVLQHSNFEASCVRSTSLPEGGLHYVYLGTAEGPILRFEIPKNTTSTTTCRLPSAYSDTDK
jgi:WD40 repeat protein